MHIGAAQYGKKKTVKGPRAIGLLQLAPNGKARLIPIAILVDGKFYDASAYKADPVPMALESEVVYEGIRTGVSQGLFTVSGALQAQDSWLGEGTWQPAGSAPAKKARTDEKPNLDDDSGPPKLRKQSGGSHNSSSNTPPANAPETSPPSSPSGAAHTTPTATTPPTTQEAPQKPAEAAPPNQSAEDDSDPNRPRLHRGKATPSTATENAGKPSAAAISPKTPVNTRSAIASKDGPSIQLIPAVSDAHGPDARPYAFEMKPGEEDSYRKKMLALAATEVQARARAMTPVMPSATPAKRTPPHPAAKIKSTAPTFDDVQFHAFDLWNTNEPVFVMTAQAHLAADPKSAAPEPRTFTITLVARADIYLDLHKLLAEVTDEQHLDEFPKFELIDAVDADGDGRGDLLFRQVSDAGTAWAIYKPTADSLYPLFEGTPSRPVSLPPDTKR